MQLPEDVWGLVFESIARDASSPFPLMAVSTAWHEQITAAVTRRVMRRADAYFEAIRMAFDSAEVRLRAYTKYAASDYIIPSSLPRPYTCSFCGSPKQKLGEFTCCRKRRARARNVAVSAAAAATVLVLAATRARA